VVTFGEAMLRLWVPPGERIETSHRFNAAVAGAEFNAAVGLARMGRSVSWMSRLPDTGLGHRVAGELERHGVDASHVVWDPDSRLGTYFVELSAPPRPVGVTYDRKNSAVSRATTADINWAAVESASTFFITGITPAISESCRKLTHELARRALAAGVRLVVDVNYRSLLWSNHKARMCLEPLCAMASLVVLTERDARTVFGLHAEPFEALSALQVLLGTPAVVMTLGSGGAAWIEDGVCHQTSAFHAEVVDRVGAGDAFAAGVMTGFLDGDLGEGVECGLAMAALTLGMFGDLFVGGPADVETVRRGTAAEVQR